MDRSPVFAAQNLAVGRRPVRSKLLRSCSAGQLTVLVWEARIRAPGGRPIWEPPALEALVTIAVKPMLAAKGGQQVNDVSSVPLISLAPNRSPAVAAMPCCGRLLPSFNREAETFTKSAERRSWP
jgi:hypothetical protein